ncbi:MAG TPA: cell wall hydrolase [Allosphingosinicella sp.]|jgi:spore germination cell wall hydrolase CwlJ-like protein|uniref:cell wall hydrolase n=1 Tax=Allosphingosinicella sp. TaxID=2823234 RepID=UPI002F2A8069
MLFNRALLSLPLLLAGASCVPAGAVPQSAAGRDLGYVDLASMDDVPDYQLILPQGATGPLPASLPTIAPEAIAPGSPAKPFVAEGQAEPDKRRSLDCLTTAIYHEARSESEDGQRAVAQVVLNRARHPAYPNSVCGVIYQGSQRRTGCQFSFTCDGSLARRIEPGAWARARGVAEAALSGSVYEPVGLATHYHTTAVRPWWAASLTRAITVGSHIFYRWRGSWGHPLAFRQTYAGAEPGAAAAAAASALPEAVAPLQGAGPVVRIAALVDGGLKVNIHRGGPKLSESEPATAEGPVRVHRSSGATGETADAGPTVAGQPIESIAAAE